MSLSAAGLTPKRSSLRPALALGSRPSGAVGQGVAHVPSVDPDVVVVDVGRRRMRPVATFPVVLVAVDEAVQHERRAQLLPQVDVVAEVVLESPHERLEVERQAVERTAVAGDGEVLDAEGRRHLRGPRERREEHGAARHAVGQRVADRDESARRVLGHLGQAGDAAPRAMPSVGSVIRGGVTSVTTTSSGVAGSRYSGGRSLMVRSLRSLGDTEAATLIRRLGIAGRIRCPGRTGQNARPCRTSTCSPSSESSSVVRARRC